MKIGMLQTNPRIGDFVNNTDKIIRLYDEAVRNEAQIVVASELALSGYPPKDLLLRKSFVDAQVKSLERLCKAVGDVGLVAGYFKENDGPGKPLFNCVGLIVNGEIVCEQVKTCLPNYDEFDESRYFESNTEGDVKTFMYRGKKVAMLICEDIWGENGSIRYRYDPVKKLLSENIDLLVTVNASPYNIKKAAIRLDVVAGVAELLSVPVVYVNQVCGHDDLVFDGRSFTVDRNGDCLGYVQAFEEGVGYADIDNPQHFLYPNDRDMPDLYNALVLGLRDYMHKSGINKAHLGLSGGVDSALTLAIAVDANGKDNVTAYSMPSKYSSDGSIVDAKKLAKNLDVNFEVIPIKEAYDALGGMLKTTIGWNEAGQIKGDVTEENVQARIRMIILMAISNRERSLLLTTGNKSEIAVGYCTLYGDMAGGFAVIADVPKTLVYKLARYVNRDGEIIPENILTKAPSAELRPGQEDQDSLPPYEILDAIIEAYVDQGKSVEEVLNLGYDKEVTLWVMRTIDGNEYKRRQMAPGIKVTQRALGVGRRMPINAEFFQQG